jgi:hypothetical protein
MSRSGSRLTRLSKILSTANEVTSLAAHSRRRNAVILPYKRVSHKACDGSETTTDDDTQKKVASKVSLDPLAGSRELKEYPRCPRADPSVCQASPSKPINFINYITITHAGISSSGPLVCVLLECVATPVWCLD